MAYYPVMYVRQLYGMVHSDYCHHSDRQYQAPLLQIPRCCYKCTTITEALNQSCLDKGLHTYMLIFQINAHLLMYVRVIQSVHLQYRTQRGERENTIICIYYLRICKETLLQDVMMHMKITTYIVTGRNSCLFSSSVVTLPAQQ